MNLQASEAIALGNFRQLLVTNLSVVLRNNVKLLQIGQFGCCADYGFDIRLSLRAGKVHVQDAEKEISSQPLVQRNGTDGCRATGFDPSGTSIAFQFEVVIDASAASTNHCHYVRLPPRTLKSGSE